MVSADQRVRISSWERMVIPDASVKKASLMAPVQPLGMGEPLMPEPVAPLPVAVVPLAPLSPDPLVPPEDS